MSTSTCQSTTSRSGSRQVGLRFFWNPQRSIGIGIEKVWSQGERRSFEKKPDPQYIENGPADFCEMFSVCEPPWTQSTVRTQVCDGSNFEALADSENWKCGKNNNETKYVKSVQDPRLTACCCNATRRLHNRNSIGVAYSANMLIAQSSGSSSSQIISD